MKTTFDIDISREKGIEGARIRDELSIVVLDDGNEKSPYMLGRIFEAEILIRQLFSDDDPSAIVVLDKLKKMKEEETQKFTED